MKLHFEPSLNFQLQAIASDCSARKEPNGADGMCLPDNLLMGADYS